MSKGKKAKFDVRHRTKELTPLCTGDTVWITDQQTEGTVVQSSGPRSYQVETPSGTIRRNRRHLNPLRDSTSLESEEINSETNQPEVNSQPNTEQTHTRSGRASVRPSRLIEDTNWQ